ncbi:MAG: prepilin-type N-terminal cleavage/methylation domain-containing protein [Pseudomonadota bacterium]
MDGELTPRDTRLDRGVSLIELLVVMTIVSVLAVGATLVPMRQDQAEARGPALFESQINTLRDLAVRGRAVYGVRVDADGMHVLRQNATDWQDLGPAIGWRGRAVLSGATGRGAAPDILILPDGRYSPFELRLEAQTCRGDGWRPVTCGG